MVVHGCDSRLRVPRLCFSSDSKQFSAASCNNCVSLCISAKEQTACCNVDYVKILANGSCIWYREFVLSVTHCPMDITWFPFDEQRCQLIYESKRYESRELSAGVQQLGEVLDHYQQSGEWNIVGKLMFKPLSALLRLRLDVRLK